MNTAGLPLSSFEPGERWVPVDRRWWGIDRKTILPAVTVFGLAVAMSLVAPVVDATTPYEERVSPGDVMEVGNSVSFVPEPGWGITAGVRQGHAPATGYPDSAVVVQGDTSFELLATPFDGDAEALLTQIEQGQASDDAAAVTGDRGAVTTDQGDQGIAVHRSDSTSEQTFVAFVVGGVGAQVIAIQPADAIDDESDAVSRMITSIRFDGQGQS